MRSKANSSAIKPYAKEDRRLLPGALAARQGDKLVPVAEVDQRLADGYLRLAAHILLRAQQQSCRSIGVMSAHDGEGTTTAAMNLAVCLGRTRGRTGRVLLVDGDARRRDLTRMVHGANGKGRHPMLVATAFEGVDLMTAPDATDALSIYDPAAWAQTLQELSGRYTQIVIDCPSILDTPEGVVLRECAEELVLVVDTSATPKQDVERALGTVGRRVLGVIANDAKVAKGRSAK